MARRACLAIGVSTVTPPNDNQAMRFGFLDGAAIAAREIGEWALRSGFGDGNVRIVTDEAIGGQSVPVTRERVQQAVDALFPPGAEVVEHLILAFCGHGLTDANFGSISWLFSDSLKFKYRVIASEFYAELLLHGIERITLITDACREAPRELDLMRLYGVSGIAVQGTKVDSPKFDTFAACQDGQLGFMVKAPNSANPGKCIFSGVIADVLWGKEPGAIKNKLITTATFGTFVRSRTAQRAKDYRLKLNPQCQVDPEEAVLYDEAKPPQGQPVLLPWPAAGTVSTMGAAVPAAAGEASRNLELVLTDESFRKRILGRDFGLSLERHDLTVAGEPLRIPDTSKDVLQDLVTLRTSPARPRGRKQVEQALVMRLETDAIADARKRAAGRVHRSLAQVKPARGRKASNVIVFGESPKVWSRDPVADGRKTAARTGFRFKSHKTGIPVMVELPDGSLAPVVPHESMYVLVWPGATGQLIQAYGASGFRGAFKGALGAIADFAAGRINAEQIDELAGRLKYGDHVDPVLGAICAYLYRASADFDSIRRMAHFYVKHRQPVPFDIALLGAMKVTRLRDGTPQLHLPAVKARKHWKGKSKPPEAVTAATKATKAWIAGRCPWLGLGWDYVGLARPDWATLVEELVDHAPEIRRSGFTVLPKKIGLALGQSWKLQPR